jgi:hypothetical protein
MAVRAKPPISRAESLDRSEAQYLDLVDFITAHPDTVFTADDYIRWERRAVGIEWYTTDSDPLVRRVQDRLDQLAVAATIPLRPKLRSPYRDKLWLGVLTQSGALYRTGHGKSGTYVLDSGAEWRKTRTDGKVTLVNHRWIHTPNAPVRAVMPREAYPPDATEVAAEQPDPSGETLGTLSIDGISMGIAAVKVGNPEVLLDPSPDELRASAEAAATTPKLPMARTATVLAVGETVGDEVVVRVETPDGAAALVIARVTSYVPAV